MTAFALLFTLACIGISETVYLVRTRKSADKKLVCPIGQGCETVLSSKWNKLFLVPNDVMGLLAYIAITILAAFLVNEVPMMHLWATLLKILVGFAALVSIFFTYLQWKVVKAWCFWCLMSAFTIWSMGIIILLSKAI